MDGAVLVLVGCILSLICVGLLAIVAFYGIRFFGGAATDIIRDVVDTGDEDAMPIRKRAPRPRVQRPQAQARTQGVDDFEAQVQQRLNNSNVLPPQGLSGYHGSALDVANDEDPLGKPRDLRSQRTRRRDHDDEPIYDDWDGGDLDLFDND